MDRLIKDKRVAVIGSGFGGLAAAIRLQAAGIETVIFEARDLPGGRAYVYRDQGFTFDAGPTVITAPTCLEELFEVAGKPMADYVTLLPVSPFYRLVWEDGYRFDYIGDGDRLVDQIRERSPGDVAGYLRFVDYAKKVFDKGYTELGAVPFLRFWDMIKVAPDLARLRADRSVYQTVAGFIKDEHLREAFSFHSLLVGGNPFETSAIYTLIHYLERQWGVFFPKGGTGALVQGLVKLFTDLGGEIRLRSPVEQITIEGKNGSVRHRILSGQETDSFDAVVSNADLHHTYATLYRDHPRGQQMGRRLERMSWSMSLFVAYFGTDRRYDDLAHHTILFGPRYKGLLREIFHGGDLPEDFSLYLHAPTVTDPSMAPPGCEAFYVLSPVPHLGKAKIDWTSAAQPYADRIYQSLERHLPHLRQHIVTQRLFTPLDFRKQLRAHHGSAFSVAPLLRQSAWFRPHNRDPVIPGLYIVGAGTHPGAGVPGVVSSAKATASVVLEDFG
ncbi:phytoene desaturase [bacterium]|nr:phytoene desaturase [bacterium]